MKNRGVQEWCVSSRINEGGVQEKKWEVQEEKWGGVQEEK